MKDHGDFAEVISEILIQLDNLDERLSKMDKRIDLTIKRMTKAESRLETLDKAYAEIREFKREQQNLNRRFTDYMNKKPL